jgi:outer membrane receptor protein involved in Fe transport
MLACILAMRGVALHAATQSTEADDLTASAPAAAEIVVTARKREERAENVPDSLVVINEATLENLQIHQAGDIIIQQLLSFRVAAMYHNDDGAIRSRR